MTTRSNIVLSYPYQQFNPAPHLTCSLASSFTHSSATATAPEALVPMPTDDLPGANPNHPVSAPGIPNSVKGAPAHLRQVIHKRQNSESAKRSRQRRKDAARRFYQRFDQQCQRISSLEKRVAQLTDLVKQEQKIEAEEEPLPDEEESTDEEQQDAQNIILLEKDDKPVASLSMEKPGVSTGALDIIDQPVQVPQPPDLSSDGAIAFEQDLEALLDSCIQSQYAVDDSFCLESPFN